MEKQENLEAELRNRIIFSSNPLPKVQFDREALEEILEELSETPEVSSQLADYLNNIESQINIIQKYQSKQHPESFYEPMRTAIGAIQNTANTIYELTKFYNASLANSFKRLVFEWVGPLEKELMKRLAMKAEEREELELKTKRLYAEQSFFSRQVPLQKALMEHLGKLSKLLEEPGKPPLRCYISYAWPSPENKKQEYWVQPFLSILYDHLIQAGIRVVMDIRDNKPGDNIYQFMKRYHEGNYVILVGTESLLQKHYSITAHAVQTELSIINDRFEQDQKQFGQSRIYPMLINGTPKSSYPEIYDKYRTVRDAREPGYIGTLKKFMDWIYEARINKVKIKYMELWENFYKSYSRLPQEPKAVEVELELGYHRQRLDSLRQDIQYQMLQEKERVSLNETSENKGASCYTFTHQAHAQTVHIAGDFNGWLKSEDGKIKDEYPEWQMKEIKSGIWQLTVDLSPETYQFKYVINKGEKWESDARCPLSSDENQNSVITIECIEPISQVPIEINKDKESEVVKANTQPMLYGYEAYKAELTVEDTHFKDDAEVENKNKKGQGSSMKVARNTFTGPAKIKNTNG